MWISGNADNRSQSADVPDNRYRYPIWRSQRGSRSTSYAVLPPTSHLPDTSLLYGKWLVALACGLPAFARGLNGRQYTLLQSTDQKVEAGWGDTVRKHLVTLVIIFKQASGAKQAGRGWGRCMQASLWVWHIDKHCSGPQVTLHWARRLHMWRLRRPASPACMFTYCYGWIFNDWWLDWLHLMIKELFHSFCSICVSVWCLVIAA